MMKNGRKYFLGLALVIGILLFMLAIQPSLQDIQMRLTGAVIPEGTPLRSDEAAQKLIEALKSLLREEFWCRLEGEHGSYIHVGWDYYLYVGVPCVPSASIEAAQADGLFVESFESPYMAH